MAQLSARWSAAIGVALCGATSMAWAISDVDRLTAVSTSGQVQLEWINPTDPNFQGVLVLGRVGGSVGDAPAPGQTYTPGDALGSSTVVCATGGVVASCTHSALTNGDTLYYRVFARDNSNSYSSGATTVGYPRASADIKWTFSTEASALNPSGAISGRSIVAIGNDGLLHRMAESNGERGAWVPQVLGSPVQSRPLVGDLNPGGVADDTAYLATQSGVLYRYSMADDATLDGSADIASAAGCSGGLLQAAPVVSLDAYDNNANGNDNVLIQATRCTDANSDGTFNDSRIMMYSHDLSTLHTSYDGGAGGLGISNAAPLLFYRDGSNSLVYVPVHDEGGESLVVLEIDSSPSFGLFSSTTGLGDIDTTPAIFKKGVDPLLVVGNTDGTMFLFLALVQIAGPGTDLTLRDTIAAADGGVKAVASSTAIGIGGNLYDHWVVWTTDSQVHGVLVPPSGNFEDSTLWTVNIPSPSAPVVLRNVRTPGDVLVYVGGANGTLYELNATNGLLSRSWTLVSGTTVGDPTFDYNDGVHQGIVAGTTAGTIHWVPIN